MEPGILSEISRETIEPLSILEDPSQPIGAPQAFSPEDLEKIDRACKMAQTPRIHWRELKTPVFLRIWELRAQGVKVETFRAVKNVAYYVRREEQRQYNRSQRPKFDPKLIQQLDKTIELHTPDFDIMEREGREQDQEAWQRLYKLATSIQRQILDLTHIGLTRNEIAARLFTTRDAIDHQIFRLRKKATGEPWD